VLAPKPDLTIEARALARRFGARWVLRGVTFQVRAGEAVGLLGHNGSGKSTLLRILATLLKPSAGTGAVCGADLVRESDAVRARTGFYAHVPGIYEDLTARENLRFAAEMLGRPRAGIDTLLDRVGLLGVADDRTRGFSTGMQRRLALARLLLQAPSVLLFDEPYNNLDVEGIALINEVIRGTLARGGSALIVVHDLAPADGIFERVIALKDGRIAPARSELDVVGSPDAASAATGAARVC
jgi:heme exporter protein A